MHIALLTGVLFFALPTLASAEEVFLICRGTVSTEYASGAKPTNFDDEISVQIDVAKHMFSWSAESRPFKTCYGLQESDLTSPLLDCSEVFLPSAALQSGEISSNQEDSLMGRTSQAGVVLALLGVDLGEPEQIVSGAF